MKLKETLNNLLFRLTSHRIYKVDMSEYAYAGGADRPDLYSHIPDSLPGKKLDIGSAFGSWAKQKYQDVVTFDQMGDADVIGDVLNMPFTDETFDAIFCFEVLEHTKDPFKAVSEIHRTTKKGGKVFASTPFMYELHGEDYGDYWRFTRQGLSLLFKDFKNIDIKHFGANVLKPHHYLVIATK